MNILILNYEYPPIGGGAGNASCFLAKALKKRKHEVVILTSAFKEHQGYSLDDGCHLYRIKTKRSSLSQASITEMFSYTYHAFFHLKKVIKKHAITHCIVYFSIPFGPLAYYAKKRWGIPYINSLRGGDVPGLVEDLNFIHTCLKPIRRKVLASAITSVANAEGLANLSKKADPQKIEVIPNGVNANFYKPNLEKRNESVFQFIFVGRFHEQKNLFYLLNEYKKTLHNFPQIHLHLVGDGGLKEDLLKHIDSLNIKQSLTWHGWLIKDQLRDLYQQCHCMINPSFYEGLPNTVLEGMASGLACIVSDIPGNNDLIQHTENGLLFDLDSDHGLSSTMIELLEKKCAYQMGEKGRENVIAHYTWGMVAEQYEKCLMRV